MTKPVPDTRFTAVPNILVLGATGPTGGPYRQPRLRCQGPRALGVHMQTMDNGGGQFIIDPIHLTGDLS
jgi:hypothetical protein